MMSWGRVSCAAARGTTKVTTAGAPTATGTTRTTGTTMWVFVAPVLNFAGISPQKPESFSSWRKGACIILSPALLRFRWSYGYRTNYDPASPGLVR